MSSPLFWHKIIGALKERKVRQIRIRILALLGFATFALMSPIEASAQYYFPPVTIDYSGACYGVTYNPSDLGAIRPDSAWDLANIGDSYSRCTIGDALWRAGVL